uniref:BTB domain-containing protein n=1 Tax=Wuchereria bancrofti TaxID=6293 RepID=A0AAF5PLB2_WUCBA
MNDDETIQTDDIDQLGGGYWDTNFELQTDYTRQSKRRHFGLEVGDVTFYVDPIEMSKKSLYFKLLTTSNHFMEGIRGSSRLYDNNDDIACMLKSTCPTTFNIYPRIIRVQSIPALARLADKYNLKNLQLNCEYFALRANFQKYGNNVLVKLLQTAIMYNYDPKLRENLIKELMIRSQFLSSSVNNELTKEICSIIVKYSLKHNGKDTVKGVCRSCGQQKTSDSNTGNHCRLWKCERCNWMYCLECKSIPCLIEVEEYLRIAFEKYEMEELRKEAESQIAEKRS